MADLAESVLKFLDKNETADTIDLAITLNEEHQKVVGAVKSLQAFGDVGDQNSAHMAYHNEKNVTFFQLHHLQVLTAYL